ncbi:MAG: hypothetical protein ACRDZQ_14475, partial [Acidimicrobiales bacterium]
MIARCGPARWWTFKGGAGHAETCEVGEGRSGRSRANGGSWTRRWWARVGSAGVAGLAGVAALTVVGPLGP